MLFDLFSLSYGTLSFANFLSFKNINIHFLEFAKKIFSFEFLETIFNEKYSVMSSYTRSVSTVLRSNCIFKQSYLYSMNSQRFIGYQCKPLPSLHGGSLEITLTVPLISPNSAEKKKVSTNN